MREPYNITFNQYRNTVTMPYIEFVVGDYMTCPLSFKWMKNDLESFNHAGTKIYLVVQTPSGKSVDDRCTINDAEAAISNILLKQDFVIEKGLHRAELQSIDVESGIVRMTSPSFSYNVRKSLQDTNTEVAKNTLTQLQEALLTASNIDVDAKVETHNTNEESHPSLVSQLNDIATDVGVCSLQKSVAQSIPNNTITTVDFDVKLIDSDGLHSTINPSRITIKKTGVYLIASSVTFSHSATGGRTVYLRRNGSNVSVVSADPLSSLAKSISINRILALNSGDYIELFANQASGGALDVRSGSVTYFQSIKIRV